MSDNEQKLRDALMKADSMMRLVYWRGGRRAFEFDPPLYEMFDQTLRETAQVMRDVPVKCGRCGMPKRDGEMQICCM